MSAVGLANIVDAVLRRVVLGLEHVRELVPEQLVRTRVVQLVGGALQRSHSASLQVQ